MAEPRIDPMNAFQVLRHRDQNPMITKVDLVDWARAQFPKDAFIATIKFVAWIYEGKGSHMHREMHSVLSSLVIMDRMVNKTQGAADALVLAQAKLNEKESEVAELRQLVEKYRQEAHVAELQLALQAPPPPPQS